MKTHEIINVSHHSENAGMGESDATEASKALAQILADVEQADKDFTAGYCVKASPEMFVAIRCGIYLDQVNACTITDHPHSLLKQSKLTVLYGGLSTEIEDNLTDNKRGLNDNRHHATPKFESHTKLAHPLSLGYLV